VRAAVLESSTSSFSLRSHGCSDCAKKKRLTTWYDWLYSSQSIRRRRRFSCGVPQFATFLFDVFILGLAEASNENNGSCYDTDNSVLPVDVGIRKSSEWASVYPACIHRNKQTAALQIGAESKGNACSYQESLGVTKKPQPQHRR
jgi:hypothetical protein